MLITATNVLAGAAQGHRRFGWAAAQGIPFNVTVIAGALLLGPVGAPTVGIGWDLDERTAMRTRRPRGCLPLRGVGAGERSRRFA